jgi:hypothetical protein
MRIEQLDELGDVGERAGETIDLADDNDVDALRLTQEPSPVVPRRGHLKRVEP